MGYGGYSGDAHEAIVRTRAALPDREVFTQLAGTNPLMNPLGVAVREAFDSDIHPASLPIVFALDVTGSMSDIPKSIARKELPTFMQEVLNRGVEDPQLLFMAVGDAKCGDKSPLQVGQFESAAQNMDQWLTMCHLEGGGGGNGGESYELAAYFLARHTATDSFTKRGHKGYVFFTGDDAAFPYVSASQVRGLVGDKLSEDIPTSAIFEELRARYEVFFLIPHDHANHTERGWRDLLGDHVIRMEAHGDTCLVAASIVALGEGKVKDLLVLAEQFASQGIDKSRIGAIVRALTPYSETLRKAGVPVPEVTAPTLPTTDSHVAKPGRGTPHERRSAARSAK